MKLINNEQAESPIEVLIVILLSIFALTIAVFVGGSVLDVFMGEFSDILAASPITNSFATGMWANVVTRYTSWAFTIPGFMVILIVVWGFKTVIRRHEYGTHEEFVNSEDY